MVEKVQLPCAGLYDEGSSIKLATLLARSKEESVIWELINKTYTQKRRKSGTEVHMSDSF